MADLKPKLPLDLGETTKKLARAKQSRLVSFTLILKQLPEALEETINFLTSNGITIDKVIDDLKTITATSTAGKVEQLFEVVLHKFVDSKTGATFVSHEDTYKIPDQIADYVKHILGFDDTPRYKPFFSPAPKAVDPLTFYPNYLGQIYNFPSKSTGAGQIIALIELGGGYDIFKVQSYFQSIGIPAPNIISVSVDGALNNPYDRSGANAEVQLDIEVAGALAPGAVIKVYFAPNSDQGFYDAISRAIRDNVSVISISWGAPEMYYSDSTMYYMNLLFQQAQQKGITVFAAAGDNGSSDGVNDNKQHVDYPGSSPYVTSCGGTRLTVHNGQRLTEVVWNELLQGAGSTGGGVSNIFKAPAYQATTAKRNIDTGLIGRTVPDLSAVADPQTGYIINVDGQLMVIGGTSAVAPLYAALIARINELKNKRVGFLNPVIYAHQECFFDVTSGNNGRYNSGSAFDACTGLGVADGTLLASVL